MTDLLFKRNAKIIIRDDNYKVEITDNRISFEIEKSINSLPNIAIINIYNPDENFINFSKRENLKIELYISYYNDSYDLLFIGDIKRVYDKNIDNDNILIIDAGDTEYAITNSFIKKSYINGVKKNTILKDCLDIMKVNYLTNTLNTITGSYNGGFVCFDKVVDILDILILSQDFEYSFQNNKIVITKKNINNFNNYIKINYDNGLTNRPFDLQNGGVEIEIYLKNINPHSIIYLDIEGYYSYYQVRQVLIKGDTKDNEWTEKIVCK